VYRAALEVNHIEPRRGAGYQGGCHHHLSNLETLCHDCHVAVTGAQRRHGVAGPARLVLPPVIPQPALLEV
jgi:5-methylcytosine-specific restriction endonuclease McrA